MALNNHTSTIGFSSSCVADANHYYDFAMRVEEVSIDPINNTSTVSYSCTAQQASKNDGFTGTTRSNAGTITVNVGGTVKTLTVALNHTYPSGTACRTSISGTITVAHKSDGTCDNVSFSCSASKGGGNASGDTYVYAANSGTSGSIAITSIDRSAASPTISNVSVTHNTASCSIKVPFACKTYKAKRSDGDWFDKDCDLSSGATYNDTWTGLSPNTKYTFYYQFRNEYNHVYSSTVSFNATTNPIYSVSYNANGGSGAPSSQTKYYNETLTLSSTKPSRTGYAFQGWSTSSSATSATYSAGASYTSNASVTLYAVWKANVLTIKYHVNNGTINSNTYYANNGLVYTKSNSSVLEDKWSYNNKHENGLYNASTFGLEHEGYKFIGWKIGTSGTAIFGQDDTSLVPTSFTSDINTKDCTITLYAVWDLNGVIYIDNGSKLVPYLVYIDNGSSWDLYIPYVDNGSSWSKISE